MPEAFIVAMVLLIAFLYKMQKKPKTKPKVKVDTQQHNLCAWNNYLYGDREIATPPPSFEEYQLRKAQEPKR